jgi:hypothetical protein
VVLEVLPRLRPGVVVYSHDIFPPFDYSPNKRSRFLTLYEALGMNPRDVSGAETAFKEENRWQASVAGC